VILAETSRWNRGTSLSSVSGKSDASRFWLLAERLQVARYGVLAGDAQLLVGQKTDASSAVSLPQAVNRSFGIATEQDRLPDGGNPFEGGQLGEKHVKGLPFGGFEEIGLGGINPLEGNIADDKETPSLDGMLNVDGQRGRFDSVLTLWRFSGSNSFAKNIIVVQQGEVAVKPRIAKGNALPFRDEASHG